MNRNILLLHCHDLGRFLGAYGVPTVVTPALDALAAESVVFDAAFSTAPTCSPARASLFTSTYPQTNGVLGLTHQPFEWDLSNPTAHLAHRLKSRGYRTELVGVHHESRALPDNVVADRLGFDRVRTGGDRDVVVQRTVEALDQAAAGAAPFYLQVGFHEPHRTPSSQDPPGVMGFLGHSIEPDSSLGHTVPAFLHDDAGARAEIAELQGAVRHLDEGVGRILAHLASLGLDDDTIVVFTTDHGLALPRAKCTLYDAGLGVSLIVRVPGRVEWANRRVDSMVSHLDVLPTLFELVGLPVPIDAAGKSLVPAVEGGGGVPKYTFGQQNHHTYYDPRRSVRSTRHKLIANFGNAPRVMDPTQSWAPRSQPVDMRQPTIASSPTFELYDLVEDPHELDNLFTDPARANVFARLAAKLLGWMRETEDPLCTADPQLPRHQFALRTLEDAARRGGEPERETA
ncbi:sulfatase [Kribbella catacumbae]|uniref:sulfatase family protein n=1 Tax=Kribbella catacumbae TaxID=460086 RepID=UPI000372B916|nr:sulfatase [Kribbella catacumbae]